MTKIKSRRFGRNLMRCSSTAGRWESFVPGSKKVTEEFLMRPSISNMEGESFDRSQKQAISG